MDDDGEQLHLFDPPPPAPPQKRLIPMTATWTPNGMQLTHWRCTFPEMDIDYELARFRAYWRTEGEARENWNLSFGNWLRNCRRWETEGRLPKPT